MHHITLLLWLKLLLLVRDFFCSPQLERKRLEEQERAEAEREEKARQDRLEEQERARMRAKVLERQKR